MKTKAQKGQPIVEDSIPIPFPTVVKKAKNPIELDSHMVEIFKKVEDRINELGVTELGGSLSSLHGLRGLPMNLPEKCDDPGPCLVSCTVGGARLTD
ncbi:hypothetical protein PIB30_063531 [Stylosanthes scabra]|uniref:Uncharacterized protein n=1 Tax=Stylosanthes scabra TaxID=79078 RepID=A0ABU6ZK90_9FABA|nr:hypothetical protein [Stylosanthes scabra]